ncbi:MAG: DUF2288 domain-containing protein [Granulosicoccus sp.]|nr:DUF2288 domain-containing protein [Granulosicoccus sp.]
MTASPPDEMEDPRSRLMAEAGVITWAELVRHFARGVVISVDQELDLIEVAISMAADDTAAMNDWLASELIVRANDDHARDWTAREPDFLCIVTAPWVLVQERRPAAALH